MNPVTIMIGVVAICYGIYTTYLRLKNPDQFGKLDAMKKKLGEGAGKIIHVVAYSVMPIIFGVVMILAGINGVSFFDL